MKVFSAFDGMSCGQIALNEVGIKPEIYYASELKKHAINVTNFNYPETVQVGDITKVKAEEIGPVDLFIGGSPCQDFSKANEKRKGLEGSKSSLFFEWLRLRDELKPKYWFFENVGMTEEDFRKVNSYLGCKPVKINSKLVSAQLRKRFYWSNILPFNQDLFGEDKRTFIPQLKDRKIFLQEILTSGYTNRKKSRCLLESESRPLKNPEKIWFRYHVKGFTTIVFESEDLDHKKGIRYFNQTELERLQTVPEGYTKILSRNNAACLLGDGWTIEVIKHFFKHLK